VGAVLLVHGGGVTRNEGGFYTRLAEGLSKAGLASLRFDLRGHGQSDGSLEDLTLAGIMNDMRAAGGYLISRAGVARSGIIAASFSGGAAAVVASEYPELFGPLVLFNPLLDYKKRFVDEKSFWEQDRLTADAARELSVQGSLPHSPTFRLGRGLLNEVFYVHPRAALATIECPTMFVHGTGDTFIPIESSRSAASGMIAESRLVELAGAQHGFAVPNDPQYRQPQTQEWQAEVVLETRKWIRSHV
jgi:pimeloyl-ACP methyl ester carboxylesterase